MSKLSDIKDWTINDFLDWHNKGNLILNPKYQRKSVWNPQAKSYFIDTILRGMPIPPIFMKQKIDLKSKRTIREIIDGQQRLTAILEFKNNKFTISKTHNEELANKFYDDLDDDTQVNFLDFDIPVELIKTDEEALIYDMFARLNTNNVVLNKQELRNARYWGEFKVIINNLSTKYKSFFIENRTFSDTQFLRMADNEFINSLLILTIDGIIAETPKKIDSYYQKYDKEFLNSDDVLSKFNNTFFIIRQIFENESFQTKFFHAKVPFYTLFASIQHQLYSLNNLEIDKLKEFDISNILNDNSVKVELIDKLVWILNDLESIIDRLKNNSLEGNSFKEYYNFIDNHKTRTTSVKERKERVSFLINYINENFNG